ncbi:hypothetical protein RUM8411_01296 [Ruegeria meonggei]|uniref:Uncharacterized protein n=2 Tax=Ruegeria meonggei TaxID=1446476 RepID=A0A1X6YU39_9RHOB|nr:hypothetical protein RUM8411_01296 [Ruegeria meonggei]
MLMEKILSYAVFAALVLGTPASAFNGRLGYQTVAVNSSIFEVIPRGRTDADGYWCAAADFARRSLGAGWQQPIYVVRGYGPSEATGRRTAVQFSITPPEGVDLNVMSNSVGFIPGQSRSVQSANGLCNRRPLFDN